MQTLIQYRYKNSNNLQTEVIGSTKNNKLVILFHQTTILYRYMKNEDRSKHVFSELLRLKQKKKKNKIASIAVVRQILSTQKKTS